MIVVGSIVIRVTDLARQMDFWTRALDYVPRDAPGEDFVVLRPRTGPGPGISLDVVPSPRILPRGSTSTCTRRTRMPRSRASSASAPPASTGTGSRRAATT